MQTSVHSITGFTAWIQNTETLSHNRNDTKVMIHQHITENNSDTIDLSNIALFNRYS